MTSQATKSQYMAQVRQFHSSIINHAYWAITSSNGNGQEAKEKYKSMMYHLKGVHQWPTV